MDEEERAALLRAQFEARCRDRLRRLLRLRGSPAARERLSENWRAPFLARLEADGDDPFVCGADPYPAEELLP
jgi:hypothetical protein